MATKQPTVQLPLQIVSSASQPPIKKASQAKPRSASPTKSATKKLAKVVTPTSKPAVAVKQSLGKTIGKTARKAATSAPPLASQVVSQVVPRKQATASKQAAQPKQASSDKPVKAIASTTKTSSAPSAAKQTTLFQLDLSQYETIALVLQGGGALGSYQAGVYEAMADAGIEPTWISGISIGALNTAIIAGNPPQERVEKLKAFWNTICQPAFLPSTLAGFDAWFAQMNAEGRKLFSAWEASRAILEGQRGFFMPRFPSLLSGMVTGVEHASFYDTSPLRSTLERFVDFDRINAPQAMHVSVGAVNVRTGNFKYFHNKDPKKPLRAEHFMASGALPPGFPAVEVDGEFYWDGGLISNTPLYDVLTSRPRRHTLALQVDLWSAKGNLPDNLYDVNERLKDIQYSSRTRLVTDYMRELQDQRRITHDLLQLIPESVRKQHALCQQAMEQASSKRFNVIHLIYRDKEYEGHFKDYEFGPLTMREHWLSGLEDMKRTLLHPSWFALPPEDQPFVTHDVHRA